MKLSSFRPKGFVGRGDKYLPEIAQEAERLLMSVHRKLEFDTLRLESAEIHWLSGILAEFAEDIHNDLGIWRTYENFNRLCFKTPLPITEGNTETTSSVVCANRVRHLLWVLYHELNHDLTLAPTHKDLANIAEAVADYLAKRMAAVPRSSGIKSFMATPNDHGWDIKRKLIWLGTRSYLFRTAYRNYAAEQECGEKGKEIAWTDDFICQECAWWSGLGVTDVLADLLPLSEEQRTCLRSWCERHAAFYRVESVEGDVLKSRNLVNGQPYTVMMGDKPHPFEVGEVIFGSLAQWGNYWYWSGVQQSYKKQKPNQLQEIRKSFAAKAPAIVYRYCKDLLEKAQAANKRNYQSFIRYHQGKDLVVYPDGLTMAADEQKRYRLMYEAESREIVNRLIEEKELRNPWPEMKYPDYVLNCGNGIGVYYNRQEGPEMMMGFNDVLRGLTKKGDDLTKNEAEAIREFVRSRSITPAFARRLVQEYGDTSIRAAFLLRDCGREYAAEYLLRRHKGADFRAKYPNVALLM